MIGNEIIFALRALFNAEDRKIVVAHLLKHPSVWQFLQYKGNIKLIKNYLGNETANWTPLNILLAANGINPLTEKIQLVEAIKSSSGVPIQTQESFVQPKNFKDYYPLFQWVMQKYYHEEHWKIFRELIEKQNETPAVIIEKFGTLLSMMLDLEPECIDLLAGSYDDFPVENASMLSANVIFLAAMNDDLLGGFFNSLRSKLNTNARIETLRQLQLLGAGNLVKDLSNQELEGDFLTNFNPGKTNLFDNFDEDLKQISILRKQIKLSGLAAQNEQALKYLNKAEHLSNRIMSELEKTRVDAESTKERCLDNQNICNKPANMPPQDDLTSESGMYSNLDTQIELFQNIHQSDRKSAHQLALHIIQSIRSMEFTGNFTAWVNQKSVDGLINLLEKILEMGVIYKARDLAELIIKFYPHNIHAIKFMAWINDQFGDKYAAVHYYGLADSLTLLENDEKSRFANALSESGYWAEAAKVNACLLKTDKEWFTKQFFYLYQSGQFDEAIKFRELHTDAKIDNALSKVLDGLIKEKIGRHIDAEIEVREAISNYEPDDTACFLAAEYYEAKLDYATAQYILDKWIHRSKEISKSVIKLLEILSSLKKRKEYDAIIQKYFSNIAISEESVFNHVITRGRSVLPPDLIEKIILINKIKWPLMPAVIAYQAHDYLERRFFEKSKFLLKPIIYRENFEDKWLEDYCLSILHCSNQDFPLGIGKDFASKLSGNERDEIGELIGDQKKSLTFRLIQLILNSEKPLDELLAYERENEIKTFENHWQINAYIGKLYFESGHFDRSISYLEKASMESNDHIKIKLYLISAYQKLSLWHETRKTILNLYPHIRSNLVYLKRVFDGISDQTTVTDVLNTLSLSDPGNHFLEVLKIYIQIKLGNSVFAHECLNSILADPNLSNDLLLFIAQLLIEIGEQELPAWIINRILNTNGIDDDIRIPASLLLYQMNEVEKTIQCISSLTNNDYINQTIKLWLKIQFRIDSDYEAEVLDLLHLLDHAYINDDNEDAFLNIINLPPDLLTTLKDPVNVIYELIWFLLEKNLLGKAIHIAEMSLNRFAGNDQLIALWLEMCCISDGAQKIGGDPKTSSYLEEYEKTDNFNLKCVLSELSIENQNEIQVAKRLTTIIKDESDKPRIKLIQARLLARTGKYAEALTIFNNVIGQINDIQSSPKSIKDMLTSPNFKYAVWFLEAAFELKDTIKAVEICLHLLENHIMTNHIIDIFLKSLASCVEKDHLLSMVGMNDRSFFLDKNRILEILEKISNNEGGLDPKEKSLRLNYCHFLLDPDDHEFRRIIESHLDELEPKSFIYSAHFLKKSFSSKEMIDPNDADTYFYSAVLSCESNPDFALVCITELVKKHPLKAEYYALLSQIKQNEGSIEEAFSAINLALDIKDNEPLWMARAGKLSELIGDDLNAIHYYEKSIQLKPDCDVEDRLIHLYIKTRRLSSANFIEQRISRHNQDDHVLKFLANSFIKIKDYHKATVYAELLFKNNNIQEALILKSRIAYELENYQKAEAILSQINESFQDSTDFIIQKARILASSDDIQTAIDFISKVKPKPIIGDERIVIYKAELIEKKEGSWTALDYLESINTSLKSIDICIAINNILINLEQFEKAELLLEKEFDVNPTNPELLAQMAIISREKGNLDRAVNLFIQSIHNDPYNVEYYLELANLYFLRREIKNGYAILREAQNINPSDKDTIKKINEMLRQNEKIDQGEMKYFASIKPDKMIEGIHV